MIFETMEKTSKKNLRTVLLGMENVEINEDELIMCPFPNKVLGKYTIIKECGIVNLKNEIKYCQPHKVEECTTIYKKRRRT